MQSSETVEGNLTRQQMNETINHKQIPKTETELEQWMKENCFNFEGYSINGNAIYEGYGIDKSGGQYTWYYTERGQKNNLKFFLTEEEIIEYAYNQIANDKWAKTHCIGFNINKNEALELAQKLQGLGIDFFQDEVPYYGLQKPVFRTFVLGCDCNRVNNLKRKYYKAPR
ncbi:hypothetical protein OCK74_19725 [Chitinophagaceae bacterium LB-8]|uniref:Uncharacterized protein n=1 Tax=Paraflavisolibacter caeni TaxID=2982496 RepID=A0A9X3B9I9_9BACT|nr:hypothetical protein [Paraflavisolibacter caeni]MCU7551361.1 hypothetical protein [Paraflavisolibacter caeni]